MDNIKAYCNAIVNQILSPHTNERIKSICIFIGAGCSSEYGIPTSFQLALDSLTSLNDFIFTTEESSFINHIKDKIEKYNQTKKNEDDISQEEYDCFIKLFIEKYKRLDINSQRHFAIKFLKPKKDSIVYKILVNLWNLQYINIVFTTNYDNLLEDEIRKIDKENSIVIYNYKDLEDLKYTIPLDIITEKFILIRLAGDLNQNIMLWTDQDFRLNITDSVQKVIASSIQSSPIVLLGYNANENEIKDILETKIRNHLSIVNNGSLRGGVYQICQTRDLRNTQNIPSKCLNFFQELIDTIYNRTQDTNLIYSFQSIKQEIKNKINGYNNYSKEQNYLVKRNEIDNIVQSFRNSKEDILVLIGDSGNGKSYYLQYLSITYNDDEKDTLFIYLEASWLGDNNIMNDIFSQLNISFEDVKKFNNKKIVFVIDGLNESQKSFNILRNIHDEVTKPFRGEVKFIISVRTEFWENLSSSKQGIELIQKSIFLKNERKINKFNTQELQDAINKYGLQINISHIKSESLKNLLKTPLHLSLINDTAPLSNTITSLNIFENFYKNEIAISSEYISTIEEFCQLLFENKKLMVKGFYAHLEYKINSKLVDVYEDLVYKRIFKDIRRIKTTFFFDKMGEYLFAKIYLHSKLTEKDLFTLLDELVCEVKSTNDIAFKIFLINSLRYFIATLNEHDINECLHSKNIEFQTLTREAVSEKGKLVFIDSYLKDPFLFSMTLLDHNNYKKIYDSLVQSENLYLFMCPINMISSREPTALKEFILFCIDNILLSTEDKQRNSLILIFNSILIYIIKNGINKIDFIIFSRIKELVLKFDENYIGSLIENVIFENLKYLLYGSNGVHINEFFEIQNKSFFEQAINNSIVELDIQDIKLMISQNMTSWIISMMLFFKDRNHHNFKKVINLLFKMGNHRLQDFVLTLLGHLSKFDKSFVTLLQQYTYDMKNNYPNIYNAKTIDCDNFNESQYDPMVPLISTNIYYLNLFKDNNEIDLKNIFMEIYDVKNEDDANNFLRLLYKIAIDYPHITLATIYEKNILEDPIFKNKQNEVIGILNTIRYFYPDIFWEETKKYRLNSIFTFLDSNYNFDIKTINQIHDWHWFNIFNFIFSDNFISFETIIQNALKKDNFNLFIKDYIK